MLKSPQVFIFCFVAAFYVSSAPAVETVRIDASTGSPRIVVDGRPVRARMFFGVSLRTNSCYQQQIKIAADVGVNFVSFPLYFNWTKPGQTPDWKSVDAECQKVLDANPDALLLPRIVVYPPDWWYEKNSGDSMVWRPASSLQGNVVVASPAFCRDAAKQLGALVEHLEEKFGPHMAGYHPCGQNTGEWFYQNTWESPLSGYSKADLLAWRDWLRARYGDDAGLRAAWRDPAAKIEEVEVPTPEMRMAAPAGTLHDPVAERRVIDFNVFQQDAMANCVCQLARAVRQATKGRKLSLFFYGYLFEFSGVMNGPATSGHYDLRRVLDCPDIDVLCAPTSYIDRGLGGSAPTMTAAESVALAGKMWLTEDDTRTHLSHATECGPVDTLEKTKNILLRNTGQCAMRNFATWWMDLMGEGWFNDPQIWVEMSRLKAIDEQMLNNPTPFRPEIAAVVDEHTIVRAAAGSQAALVPCVGNARIALGRMGSPYGQYLQDHVAAAQVPAKMYVFLSSWCLSPGQRKQLLAATGNSLNVWCYAPGYQNENGMSLDAMRELTGFEVKQLPEMNAWAEPTEAGRRLGLQNGFGMKTVVKPLFAVADAKPEEIFATYADGSAAVALRETVRGPSLFVGPPGLTSDLLRLAARRAGAHLISQTDSNVYANGPFIVLHGSQDGPVELDTGSPGDIRDALSGEIIGRGPKCRLSLTVGETRILRTDKK